MTPVPDNAQGYGKISKYIDLLVPRLDLPMDEALTAGDIPIRFHRASGGYLGSVANLVKTAAHIALDYEGDRITRSDLAEAGKAIFKFTAKTNPFMSDVDIGDLKTRTPRQTSRRTRLDGSGNGEGA